MEAISGKLLAGCSENGAIFQRDHGFKMDGEDS
jgi:hypothetical protein